MEPSGWVQETVDERDSELWASVDTSLLAPSEDPVSGTEAIVDGSRHDWRATVADCLGEYDRVTVFLASEPDSVDVVDLVAMGFTICDPGTAVARAVLDRSDRVPAPEEWEYGLVGPLAHTALGNMPGAFAVDARHLGGAFGYPMLIGDTTPWSAWAIGRMQAWAVEPPSLRILDAVAGSTVRTIPPRVAVDVVGVMPSVVDRVEARPVVGVVDPAMPVGAASELAALVGVAGGYEQRVVRPPGSRRHDRRPGRVLRDATSGAEAVLVASDGFLSQADRASVVVAAGASGVPVIADHVDLMADYLGPHTLDLVAATSHQIAQGGPFLRDAIGVRLHREVCREHSDGVVRGLITGNSFRLPTVSVVVVVDDPAAVDDLVRSVQDQSVEAEAVVVIRGGDMGRDARMDGRIVLGSPRQTTLGSALDAGIQAASGDVVVVWQAPDLHAATNVEDLLWGLRITGADAVGTGDEFLYVDGLDVTAQRSPECRWSTDSDPGRSVAIHRSILRQVGGMPATLVDPGVGLVRRIRRTGGRAARLHGYGHVVRYAGVAAAGAMLTDAVRQWEGVATAEAGLGGGPITGTRRYM